MCHPCWIWPWTKQPTQTVCAWCLAAVWTAAAAAAVAFALQVFDQMSMINLLRDNNATLADPQMGRPDIATMRSSQPTPAVHQCSSLIQGWWYWQRLSVPRVNAFRPSLNASLTPFPPASYSTMPAANISVPFFRGFAATLGGTALRATDAARGMLFAGLNGPPGRNDEAGFRRAMREVLQQSATLDDKKKTIAECE